MLPVQFTKEAEGIFEGPQWDRASSIAGKLTLSGLGAGVSLSLLTALLRRVKPEEPKVLPDMSEISLELPKSLMRRRLKRASVKVSEEEAAPGHWLEHPGAVPALTVGGLGGLLGGYFGTEWLMKKMRRREIESDLEAARKEFEDAMQSSAAIRGKAASSDVGIYIDSIYDMMEKGAEGEEDPSILDWGKGLVGDLQDWARPKGGPSFLSPGMWGGLGATGMGLTWLLIHNLAKKYFEKDDPEKLQMKALKQMQRMRYAASPPSIQFEPGPIQEG